METNITSNRTKKGLFMIVLLLVMAVVLITLGITMNKLGNKENIIEKSINATYESLKELLEVNKEQTNIGTTFTITGELTANSTGPIINSLYGTPQRSRKTQFSLSQNATDKKLLLSINDKPSNINAKYLIENSTGYYYIQGFKNTYINTGTNNYFENITSDNLLSEYKYLLDKTVESIIKSINKDNVSQAKDETYIDNKIYKLTKTTYVIDNKEAIDFLNKLLDELKKDEQSKKILLNINKNIFKNDISEEAVILEKDKVITYNVYTDFLYNIKKIELITDNSTISYEILKDSDLVRIISKDNTVTKFYITENGSKYSITVKDGTDKQLGTMTIENTETKSNISISFSDEKQKVDFNFSRDLTNIVANKSYDSKMDIALSITDVQSTEKSLVSTISLTSKVNNISEIKEDTTTAILESSLTDLERNKVRGLIGVNR